MNVIESHSTSLECPSCTLLSPAGTLRCDCGFRFTGAAPPRQQPLDEGTKKILRRWKIRRIVLVNLSVAVWTWWSTYLMPGMSVRLAAIVGAIGLLGMNGFFWFDWRYQREHWFRRRERSERWSDVLFVLMFPMMWVTDIYPRLSHGDDTGFVLGTICTVLLVALVLVRTNDVPVQLQS